MYTKNTQRQCGNRMYNSANCHNKIRKVSENKFETITLTGKHAFAYTVITKNKATNEMKAVSFPKRKQALCFFMTTVKKYDI